MLKERKMKLNTSTLTTDFDSAIRAICVVQELSDGGPHVYCDPAKRAVIIERYNMTPDKALIIIERVQKEEEAKAIERQRIN